MATELQGPQQPCEGQDGDLPLLAALPPPRRADDVALVRHQNYQQRRLWLPVRLSIQECKPESLIKTILIFTKLY